MLCLHGKPAVTSTNEKGTFWSCAESPRCFKCSQENAALYEKGIQAFLATNQKRPKCCPITFDPRGEWCYATFRVLTGKWGTKLEKENIGRPIFTCGNNHRFRKSTGCGFFTWADKPIVSEFRLEKKEDDLVVLRGANIGNLFPVMRILEVERKRKDDDDDFAKAVDFLLPKKKR